MASKTWDEWYKLAEEYYEKNGNLLIFRPNAGLGYWIRLQRKKYKDNKLTEEQIRKLESIGMIWMLNNSQVKLSWDEWYKLASEYHEKNGNLSVPQTFKTNEEYSVENVNLGSWIKRQKLDYKKNKLSTNQIDSLEKLGIVWITNIYMSWNEMYKLAQEYYEKHENLLVPNFFITDETYSMEGGPLGNWISYQRNQFSAKNISNDRIVLLNKIGMIWNISDLTWEENYKIACEYYLKTGDLLVPSGFKTDSSYSKENVNLGNWIENSRQSYANNELTKNRIKKLESIGMIWSLSKFKWNNNYSLAQQYYEKHGNLLVPTTFKTDDTYSIPNINLGSWINTQRRTYSEGTLSQDKYILLNKIGMVWELKKNRNDIRELCNEYNISYTLNKSYLKYTSYKELYCKLMYLIDNNQDYIDINGKLHDIFYMSTNKVQEVYGINLEELITKYYSFFDKHI